MLCLTFSINSLQETQNIIRRNLLSVITGLGSITYLLRNLGNAVTKSGNAFGLDNSMIKRLYSVDRECDGHTLDVVENDPSLNTGRQELIDTLDKREYWSYSWAKKCFAPKGYCCCRCLCCKPEMRQDRLFKKARATLHDEIDMLHIIKQLRV